MRSLLSDCIRCMLKSSGYGGLFFSASDVITLFSLEPSVLSEQRAHGCLAEISVALGDRWDHFFIRDNRPHLLAHQQVHIKRR